MNLLTPKWSVSNVKILNGASTQDIYNKEGQPLITSNRANKRNTKLGWKILVEPKISCSIDQEDCKETQ